ncbi:hypothetical protein HGM15179_006897 [Zosterops borbonicus]|uniref:Uncharacterized protein n=1 Tax=Zosterops borbonicus TaxID=364589 RepID=A0A8K1LNL4_9PASS|nr:hypothetical protein HGM15179_006897 [Zosterops borbonicus]
MGNENNQVLTDISIFWLRSHHFGISALHSPSHVLLHIGTEELVSGQVCNVRLHCVPGKFHTGLCVETESPLPLIDDLLRATSRRNSFLTTMPISSTLWRNKQNEISIRLTREIDIRKELSRNETMGLDKIREGHRTIQPILDTWTA